MQDQEDEAGVSSRTVTKAKGQPFELILTEGSGERRFSARRGFQKDLVERSRAVESAEHHRSGQTGQIVVDRPNGVRVLDGDVVETAIINTPPDLSIFLGAATKAKFHGDFAGSIIFWSSHVSSCFLRQGSRLGLRGRYL